MRDGTMICLPLQEERNGLLYSPVRLGLITLITLRGLCYADANTFDVTPASAPSRLVLSNHRIQTIQTASTIASHSGRRKIGKLIGRSRRLRG